MEFLEQGIDFTVQNRDAAVWIGWIEQIIYRDRKSNLDYPRSKPVLAEIFSGISVEINVFE